MIRLRGKQPRNLGVNDHKLAPIVKKPNNVSSQAEPGDSVHYVAPIKFEQDPSIAMQRLLNVLRAQPRTAIIKQDERYVQAEFSSALLGFVDDVEFYFIPDEKLIHVRSASRLGYSDLGVNRKR